MLITDRERLREAQEAERKQTLTNYEKDFLEESADRLTRERRIAVGIAVALVVIAIASYFAETRRRELKSLGRVALSRIAAGASMRAKAMKPDLAAVLAAQAARFADTFEARSALLAVHLHSWSGFEWG